MKRVIDLKGVGVACAVLVAGVLFFTYGAKVLSAAFDYSAPSMVLVAWVSVVMILIMCFAKCSLITAVLSAVEPSLVVRMRSRYETTDDPTVKLFLRPFVMCSGLVTKEVLESGSSTGVVE